MLTFSYSSKVIFLYIFIHIIYFIVYILTFSGTIGFFATFWFVRKIYSVVKVD